MKKCPTCGKEFEDSMKFCQIDGTSLEPVAEETPFDPYATMVSMPSKPAETPLPEMEVLPPLESTPNDAVSTPAQDDLLDIPQSSDPHKTTMVSTEEFEQYMASGQPAVEETPDIPTPAESLSPEVPDAGPQSFGEMAPPPSPFSTPEPEPQPAQPAWDEAATIMQPPVNVPFEPPSPVQEWTPPPVPDPNWQNQQIGSNTPFQPPPSGVGGQNKTLAIVSLVLGILSICCYVSPVTGLGALVCGLLALKNIKNDPSTYGGKGLAIAGMICGAVFLVIGVVYYILLALGIASGALR